jgi:oligopeptide/dipeptide ABC transporter ATP-binding protein
VSFDLEREEVLAVVGESGSGKSTLARCILRLVQPTGGKIFFRDRDVLEMTPRELRDLRGKVQMVFQDPFGSLNPRMRAGTMLEEVLQVHEREISRRGREEKVIQLLDQVGLHAAHVRRFPHELSGGQRQRLGIARALAVGPELLILDEPVSSLDLSVQAQILTLLRELQSRLGLTLLLVAHDLSVVRQVADRSLVLFKGTVVEEGPVPSLLERPVHPCTKGLVADASPGLMGEDEWRDAQPSGVEARGSEGGTPSCVFYERCPHPRKDGQCLDRAPDLTPSRIGGRVACWKEMGGKGRA